MNELKLCPFCGCEAKIDFSSVTEYGNRSHQNGEVACSNRDCDAEVGLYDFNPDDKSINPTDILTKKWNTRAPQNEWISVDDMLPDGGHNAWSDKVIAICDEGFIYKLSYFNGEDGGCWQRTQQFAASISNHIVGWIPMPTPPEDIK